MEPPPYLLQQSMQGLLKSIVVLVTWLIDGLVPVAESFAVLHPPAERLAVVDVVGVARRPHDARAVPRVGLERVGAVCND